MKKRLVASILGIVATIATVTSSYGQGQVWFDNYNNKNANGPASGYSSPITFSTDPAMAPTGMAGAGLPGEFTAQLFYVLGTAIDPNAGIPTSAPIGTSIMTVPIKANTPGYVNAGIATVPDYVSGAVTFQVYAAGTVNGVEYVGKSDVLVLPSISTGTTLPGYLDGLQSFSVVPVPEPTTLVLAGLGGAALLMLRRRN